MLPISYTYSKAIYLKLEPYGGVGRKLGKGMQNGNIKSEKKEFITEKMK